MLCCAIGLATTFYAWRIISSNANAAAQMDFQRRAAGTVSDIEEAFHRYETFARGARGLFDSSRYVSDDELVRFVKAQDDVRNLVRANDIWIIRPNDPAPVGMPEEVVSAARAVYTGPLPVPRLVPDQNGYVDHPHDTMGWLITPLRQTNSLRPTAIVMRLPLQRLIDNALREDSRMMDVEIFDIHPDGGPRFLFDSDRIPDADRSMSTYEMQGSFDRQIAGHPWRFVITGRVIRDRVARAVLWLGIFCSLLLTGFVMTAARTGVRARALAEHMTADLRAAKLRYRDIFNRCADGIFCCDTDGKLTAANGAIARQLGYASPQSLVDCGRSIGSHFEPKLCLSTVILAAESMQPREVTVTRPDGSVLWLTVRLCPVCDELGRLLYVQGLSTDITELRNARIESELRSEAEAEGQRLRQSVVAMERVLGIVGHELRTPLASIRAMSEAMLGPVTTKLVDHKRYVGLILNQAAHLVGIVGNVLDVARYNSGTASWQWDTVNLREACDEAVDTVRPLLNEGVKIAVDVHPDIVFPGDPTAIRRLLVNLLSNACKFTTEGQIGICCAMRDEYIRLRVRDTGQGIEPEKLPHVGKPFALSSGAVDGRHIDGTGLGVSLCIAIAAAHGGRMAITSKLREGTSVDVWIRRDLQAPAAPAHVDLVRRAA